MKNYTIIIILLVISSFSLFGDVYNLERAIKTALENNETVKVAAQELEKSEYVYNEAFT